jgi:hypothetical protein
MKNKKKVKNLKAEVKNLELILDADDLEIMAWQEVAFDVVKENGWLQYYEKRQALEKQYGKKK